MCIINLTHNTVNIKGNFIFTLFLKLAKYSRAESSRDKHIASIWKNHDSLPDNGVLTGLVLGLSLHTDHLHATGVEGCWDAYLRSRELKLCYKPALRA